LSLYLTAAEIIDHETPAVRLISEFPSFLPHLASTRL
jgi:hypothetical protein